MITSGQGGFVTIEDNIEIGAWREKVPCLRSYRYDYEAHVFYRVGSNYGMICALERGHDGACMIRAQLRGPMYE